MTLEHDEHRNLIDVLDRVLDKGVVIDAWVRVSLVGVDLITVEARVVVASIETYLMKADALSVSLRASPPGRGHEPRPLADVMTTTAVGMPVALPAREQLD